MINEVLEITEEEMKEVIERLQKNFASVRTGRANASILDGIKVDYYGVLTPINQMAAIKVPDAHQLSIEPWEKSQLSAIEKAISESKIGITPNNDGVVIRLPFPQLTEERRKDLCKECSKFAEEARIGIRNCRRSANSEISKTVKDEGLPEDDEHKGQEKIQNLTNKYIKQIDDLLAKKEADVMAI